MKEDWSIPSMTRSSGMPSALAGSVGIVNFIGAYISFLGAFIGGAFAVLMALTNGGIGLALGALAVVLFTNIVLENVLEPRYLGASLNLHNRRAALHRRRRRHRRRPRPHPRRPTHIDRDQPLPRTPGRFFDDGSEATAAGDP
jgi:hypothetical protein